MTVLPSYNSQIEETMALDTMSSAFLKFYSAKVTRTEAVFQSFALFLLL
jgi:hypothetical protein